MPASLKPTKKITPSYRLGENSRRMAEGGIRVAASAIENGRQRPEISVVTVVLNGEDYLGKTIQSVVDQLNENCEYIIIDGGSTDATLEIIRKFDQNLEYWISEPDQGISDAFNKGISLCRGRLVGLLNCGDWYEPDTLAQVKQFFLDNPDVGVLCGKLQYWQGEKRAYIAEPRPELLEQEMSVTHPTCFVMREAYLRHGGFDSSYRYAMDYELMLRLHVEGVGFAVLPQILAHMLHEGISEQQWQGSLRETWQARQRYVPHSPFARRWYYWYLIVRKRIRFILEAIGLHGVIRFYREKLAPVKKKISEE